MWVCLCKKDSGEKRGGKRLKEQCWNTCIPEWDTQLAGRCCGAQRAHLGALWWPRGTGSGTRLYLWLVHAEASWKPTQHRQAVILQLRRKRELASDSTFSINEKECLAFKLPWKKDKWRDSLSLVHKISPYFLLIPV